MLYVCNVDEEGVGGNEYSAKVREALGPDAACECVCVSVEAEASTLGSDEDITAFLKDLGMQETGLSKV